MENNFLVANDGTIMNPQKPLYLCEWNSGDIVQIHTRESLYKEFINFISRENEMERENLPNHLANKARKIAYKTKVSTNSILEPMLIKHGFEDGNGNNLETYSHLVGFDELLYSPLFDSLNSAKH